MVDYYSVNIGDTVYICNADRMELDRRYRHDYWVHSMDCTVGSKAVVTGKENDEDGCQSIECDTCNGHWAYRPWWLDYASNYDNDIKDNETVLL